MEKDTLVQLVSNVVYAIRGEVPSTELTGRITAGVDAALAIKAEDPHLYHALVAIGISEGVSRVRFQDKDTIAMANTLVTHYASLSEYLVGKPQ